MLGQGGNCSGDDVSTVTNPGMRFGTFADLSTIAPNVSSDATRNLQPGPAVISGSSTCKEYTHPQILTAIGTVHCGCGMDIGHRQQRRHPRLRRSHPGPHRLEWGQLGTHQRQLSLRLRGAYGGPLAGHRRGGCAGPLVRERATVSCPRYVHWTRSHAHVAHAAHAHDMCTTHSCL